MPSLSLSWSMSSFRRGSISDSAVFLLCLREAYALKFLYIPWHNWLNWKEHTWALETEWAEFRFVNGLILNHTISPFSSFLTCTWRGIKYSSRVDRDDAWCFCLTLTSPWMGRYSFSRKVIFTLPCPHERTGAIPGFRQPACVQWQRLSLGGWDIPMLGVGGALWLRGYKAITEWVLGSHRLKVELNSAT